MYSGGIENKLKGNLRHRVVSVYLVGVEQDTRMSWAVETYYDVNQRLREEGWEISIYCTWKCISWRINGPFAGNSDLGAARLQDMSITRQRIIAKMKKKKEEGIREYGHRTEYPQVCTHQIVQLSHGGPSILQVSSMPGLRKSKYFRHRTFSESPRILLHYCNPSHL